MNAPKRKGTDWERRVADYAAQQYGLPWDRAPLRGTRDLLDIQGCLADGWLVECKALSPRAEQANPNGVSGLSARLSDGVAKFPGALANLRALYPDLPLHLVTPFVVVQRPRVAIGDAYAVTTYDHFLRLVLERRAWDAWERGDD